ncbi:MAG: octanoyltransferase, partial [Nitrososphaerales archaeon]
MTESFRFIGLESHDAGMNMAIDEAIMNSRREDKVSDTFRLYRWQPSAISIGFFQSIAEEVNLP